MVWRTDRRAVRRHSVRHRRVPVLLHEGCLAAEALLVELERGLASTIEAQVRIDSHRSPRAGEGGSSKNGRISISASAPGLRSTAKGARLAHSIASSFDFTWISQYPATSSCVHDEGRVAGSTGSAFSIGTASPAPSAGPQSGPPRPL